jgi:hypothetical protein
MVISPPTGKLLLGAGPAFLFPTATTMRSVANQWGAGPALVVGYLTEKATFVVFGQYYWGIGWQGDREPGERDASYLSLLYLMYVNLPDAWQFGFSPTITYDPPGQLRQQVERARGPHGHENNPGRKMPVKFQFGVEYSVVSQDAYGEQAEVGARGDPGDSGIDPPLDSGR